MLVTNDDGSVNSVSMNISSIASSMVTNATASGTSAASRLPKISTSTTSTSGKTIASARLMSLAEVSMFSSQVIAEPPTWTRAPWKSPL